MNKLVVSSFPWQFICFIATLVLDPEIALAVGGPQPTLDWIRQLGTSNSDINYDVSTDGLGSVYTSGYTQGSLAAPNAGGSLGFDVLVTKYNSAGNLVWTRQLSSSGDEESFGLSADRLGNVFVAGYTTGNLAGTNAGGDDAFIARYDAGGNLIWTRQLGSGGQERASSVASDGIGNAYVAGVTAGSLAGGSSGSTDAFLFKLDVTGNIVWQRQFGTSGFDGIDGLAADALGNIYFSG